MMFISTIVSMFILIIFPNQCKDGTKEGLMLWYNSILPALLPYMILTNILINNQIFLKLKNNSKFISPYVLLSIFVGFFCGYPMGAFFVSKAFMSGKLSKSQAYWLYAFVNLSSPAYIIQYVCIDNLNGKYVKELIVSIYGAAVILALILLPVFVHSFKKETKTVQKQFSVVDKDISDCILDAFHNAIKLCGYIVLFSITVKMVTAHINTVTIRHIFLIGILEQTNGISLVSEIIGSDKLSAILMSIFTSFSSVSCIFQTAGVCKESSLKIPYYICAKILQAIICAGLMFLIL